MTDPSPAAKAVLDAYNREAKPEPHHQREAIAAALRAAVEQAIPLMKTPWGSTLIPVLTARESRDRLLAIIAELEGAQ